MTAAKYFAAIIVSLLVVQSLGASIQKRSIAQSSEDVMCQKHTPCGWAVYEKFTRTIEYFMKNKCECPIGKRCLRMDDDISISAYVYRCKESNITDITKNS